LFYNFVRFIFNIIVHLIFRIKTYGLEDFPEKDAVILYLNHKSMWDPIIVCCLLKRPIHFIAKEELFYNPLFGLILRNLNAFPVKRGTADRKAIKRALEVLDKKQVLGIFPEGTRSKDGTLREPEPGVALIAAKSKDALLIPAAIVGDYKFFSNIEVRFGKAISFEKYNLGERLNSRQLKEISVDLFAEVAKLMQS